MPAQHLTVGTTVYDTAGATVGTLDRYEPQGSYLVARRGVLFPRDIYIPLHAFGGTDATGNVRLAVRLGDLLGQTRGH